MATTTSLITISQVIDQRPLSWLQIRTMLLCSLVVFADGYDLQTIGLVLPVLGKQWSIGPETIRWVVISSMLGVGVGSAIVSPLGDRFGRRPLIVFGLAMLGLASLGTTYSTNATDLFIWRVLTGIGIGICQSNATALTAEYAPLARRAGLMTLMGLFVVIGAIVAGFTADLLLRDGNWKMLFIIGGAAPLALAVLFQISSPESVRFLLARNVAASDRRIATVLQKIAPDIDPTKVIAEPSELARSTSMLQTLLDVVRRPYLERTLHFWGLYALTTGLLYSLVSWLPTLLANAGWKNPSRGMMIMQIGGLFGSLVLAWAVDRGRTIPALLYGYAVAGIAAILFLVFPAEGLNWYFLVALMGVGISGGMLALAALGAMFYPPAMRATGYGWGAAVGRVGAIALPFLIGSAMPGGTPSDQIIAWLAVPAAICGLIVISMRGVMKRL